MSDFVPRDILPDLWEEILQRHWTFLETEESMQKLEERKKLEACLKEFLCVVPHDRKFFLPETAHVLKKTVKELDDFNAFKAMVGFDSISQYANNLFTKPWRKEYRIIKMYSGFYQHEIKSNLVDAEKLFEAMGYRQISNQILVLDGPICPDQVTNVSRDAMAAYVECQIMKQIKAGLTALPLVCSWNDVFKFRETHLGGASQAIKAIAYAEQERRYRAKKLAAEAQFTSQIASPPVAPKNVGSSSCDNCAIHGSYHHHLHPSAGPPIHQIANGCNMRSQPNYNLNPSCTIHHGPNNMIHCKHPNYSQMSHSRSLEHYNNEQHSDGPPLPHRHSFDQPQQPHQSQHLYDNPYDCVDNYQNSCNFNAYNHPYNVSGNRYPLPYNISNQLNNHNQYAYNGSGNMYHPVAGCGHKIPPAAAIDVSAYGDCNGGYAKINPCNYPSHQSQSRSSGANKDFQNFRQRSFPPDHQLIDFEERPAPHELPHSHSRSQNNSFDIHDRTTQAYDNRRNRSSITQAPQTQPIITQKDIYSRVHNNHIVESSDDLDGNYVYATPIPVKHRKPPTTDKYLKNSEILQEYEKILDNKKPPPLEIAVHPATNNGTHNNQHSHASLENFNSFDDFVNNEYVKVNEPSPATTTKPLKANKNQDGVGSFESWDYVFQNLEKHGYSKDLGERGDLLVQSLDLDSMNISTVGTIDKRRVGRNPEPKHRPMNGDIAKSKTLEKVPVVSRNRNGTEKSILKVQSVKSTENGSAGCGGIGGGGGGQVLHLKPSLKTNTKHLNNNFEEDNHHHHHHQQQQQVAPPIERVVSSRLSSSSSRTPSIITANNASNNIIAATQVIVTSPNEWSCRFCTFLNPDTKRVCEMCSKSKNLILESTNTPTCV